VADLPSEANLALVHEDSDLGDVDGALDELRRRLAASRERISDLGGELKEAADEEAETAQRLDVERGRRGALERQLHRARKEATRLILHEASRLPDARSSGSVDEAAGTKIASEETAALVKERDRLAGEVADLANAVVTAQDEQAELSRTVDGLRRERDEILTKGEQARADQGGAARIMSDEAGHSIETAPVEMQAVERDEFQSRGDEPSDDDDDVERPTRYERASAKLPSIGDDASEVIGSLEDLRESLRRR
jgi:septal ring factor EnvC (AmiA/AmiB activator)